MLRYTSQEICKQIMNVISEWSSDILTGQLAQNDATRDFLALPCHLEEMGLGNPTALSGAQSESLLAMCEPILSIIRERADYILSARMAHHWIKQDLSQHSNTDLKKKANKVTVQNTLSENLCSCATAAQEIGVCSWLTALPIANYGFALDKRAFVTPSCCAITGCWKGYPKTVLADKHLLSITR